MAVLSDYTSGRISLANGSTTVTGTGTLFNVAKFREGDTLQIQNMTAVIASVNSDTSLTLTAPWSGTTLTNAIYRARYLPDGARVTAQATTLIELLGSGNLQSIAGLTGAADKGLMFTGEGTAGTFDLPQRGRDLLAGVSTVGLAVAVAANATAARTAIDAQANLGYAPINRAGDAGLTGNYVITSPDQYSRYIRFKIFGASSEYQIDLNGEYSSSPVNTMNAYLRVKGLVGDAYFRFNSSGSLAVPGAFTAGSKSFKIDHSSDPYNKDLVFMSTEAPKAGVEFWGTVKLTEGHAEVDIDLASNLTPGTFVSLTQNAIIVSVNNLDNPTYVHGSRIVDGKFSLQADGNGDYEVSWHVKAERADPFIKTHPYCDPETGLLIPEHDKEDA